MKCYEVERLAHAFHDGELDDFRRHELKKHLSSCSGCTNYLAMVEVQLDTLRLSLKLSDPGEDFTSRVMAAVRRGINVVDLPKVYHWHPGRGMLMPGCTSYIGTSDLPKSWSDYREWREVWRRISQVSHTYYLARTSQG